MTADDFRLLALSLPESEERAHMGHPDFRVGGKIFATLWADGEWGMVKLTPNEQDVFVQAAPKIFEPVKGTWGARGCTKVRLSAARKGVSVSAQRLTLLDPDPCGQLRHATGAVYSHLPRTVPLRAVIHDSVFERVRGALPVYAPQSLFKLNEEILRMRGELKTQVTSLAEIG